MHATLSLFRREFTAYFYSPIAYVVLAVFLAVTGTLFWLTVEQLTAPGPRGVDYPMHLMLSDPWFWLVFLFIPPLLTMRLFAEERSTGNLEMLLTSPLREWQIVASKFLACFGFYLMMWLPTLVYLPILLDLSFSWDSYEVLLLVGGMGALLCALVFGLFSTGTLRWVALGLLAASAAGLGLGFWFLAQGISELQAGIDPMSVLSSYLGLMLVGAMFLALGLFISSLVRSQMVAALVAMFVNLAFIVAGFWLKQPDMDTGDTIYQVLFFFTVPLHFERFFSRGQVDTRQLVLYGTVALFCLFMTVRSLESRRWR